MPFLEKENLHEVRNPAISSVQFHWRQEEFLQFNRRPLLSHAHSVEPALALERPEIVSNGDIANAVDLLEARRWICANQKEATASRIERDEGPNGRTKNIVRVGVQSNTLRVALVD